MLIVMDGYGFREDEYGNAEKLATTPTLDRLFKDYPWLKLKAHGRAVGQPSDEDMGNSEVGHNAMGAGRVYAQGALLVNESLQSGAVFQGEVWQKIVKQVRDNNSTLHFLGLLSNGNIHSNIAHLLKMLDEASLEGVTKVRVHILLDGRDTPPQSALEYVKTLEDKLAEINASGKDFCIASGGGRQQIVMDRYEANWALVGRGWQTTVEGEGRQFSSAKDAIETFRQENPGVTDQDLPPFIIAENGMAVGKVDDNDAVIMFNFRGDRAIEISSAFDAVVNNLSFDKFVISRRPKILFAAMLEYDSERKMPAHFLVAPPVFRKTLGEFLADHHKRQLAISETQKYGHLTYFFNGNRADKFNEQLETYIEISSDIPSDLVSFDEKPEMKTPEIAGKLVEILQSGERYDFIRVNFTNPDMVGHTGNIEATIKGVEAVDEALAKILPAIDAVQGMALITADHGNAEEMYETKNGEPVLDEVGKPRAKTAHTLNPVPCIFYDNTDNKDKYAIKRDKQFGLSSFAQTVADLMKLDTSGQEWDEGMVEIK